MDLADNPFEETEQKPANLPLIEGVSPLIAKVQPQTPDVSPLAPPVAVADRFVKAGQPHRFTPANARLFAQKSIEARDARKNPPAPNPLTAESAVDKMSLRVQKIDERIDEVIQQIEDSDSARDTQALCMALDRLCGVWSLLTGHPRPGVRKTDTKRGRPAFAQPQE